MYTQIPALALGILAAASVITTTFWNQWSVSGPTSKGVLGPIWAWRSLFGECMQYQGGQSQCQGQNSMFLMSGYKLALRGFMITSIILSTLGCIGIFLGMECTKVFTEKRNFKRKVMFVNGICFLLSAIFTFAAVVWYTFVIYDEFFKFENQDNYIQWELGACVYLGYVASFFCALAFLACICRPGPREENEKERSKTYYYKPRPYEVKTSRDDEHFNGFLGRYRSRYPRSKSSHHSSSKHSSSKHSSSHSSSRKSPKHSSSTRRSSSPKTSSFSARHSSSHKHDLRRHSDYKHKLSHSKSSGSSSIKSYPSDGKWVDEPSSLDQYAEYV